MRRYILLGLFFIFYFSFDYEMQCANSSNIDSTIAKKINSIPSDISLPYDVAIDKYLTDNLSSDAINLNIFYKYESFIDSLISSKRLPGELKYLAYSISNMNIRYCGKYDAGGIWGIYPPVAAKYGLHITPFIDQRYDVKASTIAALEYLYELYSKYNDWWQAIMIYTNGMPAYLKATKSLHKQGLEPKLWNYYYHTELPNREIIPCYIATIYKFYYFYEKPNIEYDDKDMWVQISIKNAINISDLLKVLNWYEKDFKSYNPIWVGGLILPSNKYQLLLPKSLSVIFYKYEDSLYLSQQRKNSKYLADELDSIDSIANGEEDSIDSDNLDDMDTEENKISEFKVSNNINTSTTPKTIIHKVQKGETLSHIAERYRVSVKNIMIWNNLKNDKIYEGQKLKIIKHSNTQQNNFHVVQVGESIWSIAKKYNVSEQDIMKWNNLTTDKIYPGQKLIIYPNQYTTSTNKSTSAQSNKTIYVVKSGDTIWSIANKYNVSEADIMKWNNLKNDKIFPGQKLLILK